LQRRCPISQFALIVTGPRSGGTTYTALASLLLAPAPSTGPSERLTAQERRQTIRWLIHNQEDSGGFRGRTGKEADSCYCFWCGASLQVRVVSILCAPLTIGMTFSSEMLGAKELIEVPSLAAFLASCQFKYGGIAKEPEGHPGLFSALSLGLEPPVQFSCL
jgi:geranylgeranyl transferase type-1 subunit beta